MLRVAMLLSLGLLLTAPAVAGSGLSPGPGPWRQFARPELGGFDAGALEHVYAAADTLGTGAFLVVRGGQVVVAYGDLERKFKCHSVRKSLLSALIGRAVERGEVDLSATLAELDVDDLAGLTDRERSATVEHLLQARSGVYHPAAKEPRGMKKERPARGSHGPGEHFWYNNWDFNTLGAIYEQATGRGIFDAFAVELAQPLGMQDFQVTDTVYQYERNLSRVPAYAFRLTARDAARFGLLYLREGDWAGKQLVPAEWVERSFRAHSDLGEGRGYGYMWWIYGKGAFADRPDLEARAASGTGGQLIAVLPAYDLVVVHRADTDFGRGVSGGVWGLVRGVVDAIDGPVQESAKVGPVRARPFSKGLPELVRPATVDIEPKTLESYAGSYTLVGPGHEVKLWRVEDVLVGRMPGYGEADFWPIGPDRFFARAVGAHLRFERAADGSLEGAVVTFRGQEFKVVRSPSR